MNISRTRVTILILQKLEVNAVPLVIFLILHWHQIDVNFLSLFINYLIKYLLHKNLCSICVQWMISYNLINLLWQSLRKLKRQPQLAFDRQTLLLFFFLFYCSFYSVRFFDSTCSFLVELYSVATVHQYTYNFRSRRVFAFYFHSFLHKES